MNNLKYVGAILVLVILFVGSAKGDSKNQYFFIHIIFDPLLRTISSDDQMSSSISGVLSGNEQKSISRTMVLRRIPGQDDKIEITFPAVKEVKLVAFLNQKNIEKIIRYDGTREDIFTRAATPVSSDTSKHMEFSVKQYLEFYQQEELKLLIHEDCVEIPLEIFYIHTEDSRIEVLLKLQTENYFRAIKYQNDQLLSSEHLMRFNQQPWLRLVAHFYRFRDSWYLGDSYSLDADRTGKYIEYYPDGLVKNYVESLRGQWKKQKAWFRDGSFDAEYQYPPGKVKVKIKSTLNPNWLRNMPEFRQWKLENSSFWDEATQSPYYEGALQIFEQQYFFPITLYFSQNQDILKHKFLALQKELSLISGVEVAEIGEDRFIFQSADKSSYGICVIDLNMIFLLNGTKLKTIEKIAIAINQAYLTHQQQKEK